VKLLISLASAASCVGRPTATAAYRFQWPSVHRPRINSRGPGYVGVIPRSASQPMWASAAYLRSRATLSDLLWHNIFALTRNAKRNSRRHVTVAIRPSTTGKALTMGGRNYSRYLPVANRLCVNYCERSSDACMDHARAARRAFTHER